MTTSKEIHPNTGLGKVKFGMDRNQVRLILGEPDEISPIESEFVEDDKQEVWHYDEEELSLAFDGEEGFLLTTLAVSGENASTLNQVTLLGKSMAEVKSNLESMNFEDLELEDWSNEEVEDYKLLLSESASINFWFEEGKLTEIQWGPAFSDEDTILWPE